MTVALLKVLAFLAMVVGLATVPFGVPGVWIMVAVLLATVLAGWTTWTTWGVLAGLALVSELMELAMVKVMGDRYGGSRGAFLGAVAGGMLGLFVGVPVPLLGPLIAGLIGTFAGAAVVTLYRTRSLRDAGKVGWGVSLARVWAVGLKVGVGVAILAVGVGAMLLD